MKKICVFLTGLVFVGALMVGCNKGSADNAPSVSKEMYLNKTPYVGDNSKVLALVGLQNIPPALERKETRLETSNTPYGVVVSYEFEDKKTVLKDGQFDDQGWIKNAIVLLSLIENADFITYEFYETGLETQSPKYAFTYTRNEANEVMGTDVINSSDSEDRFLSFYEEVFKGEF